MPAKKKAANIDDLCFEDAIERLEDIIEHMEGERIPLDSMLKDYDEGTRLLKACRVRIETARTRIETITKTLATATQDDDADGTSTDDSDDLIQLL